MSNTPNFKRAPSLAEYADKRREEASIEIPIDDGDPIVVPPREFWTKTTKALLLAQKRRDAEATDEVVARSIVGDDGFDRFAAEVEKVAGPDQDVGSFFFQYLSSAIEAQQGVSEGE